MIWYILCLKNTSEQDFIKRIHKPSEAVLQWVKPNQQASHMNEGNLLHLP